MKFTLLPILLCCALFSWNTNCTDKHHHGSSMSREKIFESIYEHLDTNLTSNDGHTLINLQDMEKLFQDLNFRNCSEKSVSTTNCNLCFTALDFWKWNKLNTDQNITEEEFQEKNKGLLYLLTKTQTENSSSVVCKDFIQDAVNQSDEVFSRFQNKYGRVLNEKSVESILAEINSTIGKKLTNKDCFSSHDVIKGANVSESNITEHDFEYVAGYIILKLVDKHCIKDEHEEHNPNAGFFLSEIFEEYGKDDLITEEGFKKLYAKLKLGETTTEDEHDHHEDEHKTSVAALKDGHDDGAETTEDEHHHSAKCYSAEQILTIYSVPHGGTINKAKFNEICPSLVQQLESSACVDAHDTATKSSEQSNWKPWVGMLISVFVISLGSLGGALTVSVAKKEWFKYLILGMISLAVSVLIGDAMLHLLPHSLGFHAHEHGAHDHGSEEGNPILNRDSYLWKILLFLLGVYIFFMFEVIMHTFNTGHTHSHNQESSLDSNGTNAKMNEDGTVIHFNKRADEVVQSPTGLHEYEMPSTVSNTKGSVSSLPTSDKFGYAKKRPGLPLKEFKTLAWIILIGDGIHNFLDGVAIGVAFSEKSNSGIYGGISTSIAIFCHELPHELGDFAVLLSSGLSIKQALIMNYISSLTALIGGVVGVALGTQWNGSSWIFAITAGLFVYIALVNMLPEVLHSNLLKKRPLLCILVANAGIMLGMVIMFVLSIYEDDMKQMLT